MLRRVCELLLAPLVLATLGCTGSDDQLPTVPPPPPPGTIKAASGGARALPDHVMEKLKQRREQAAAKEAETAKTEDPARPATSSKNESPKSEVQK